MQDSEFFIAASHYSIPSQYCCCCCYEHQFLLMKLSWMVQRTTNHEQTDTQIKQTDTLASCCDDLFRTTFHITCITCVSICQYLWFFVRSLTFALPHTNSQASFACLKYVMLCAEVIVYCLWCGGCRHMYVTCMETHSSRCNLDMVCNSHIITAFPLHSDMLVCAAECVDAHTITPFIEKI